MLGGLVALLIVVSVAAISLGPVPVPPGNVAAVLAAHLGLPLGEVPAQNALVVDQIRLPRILVAALVGAALGVAGAVMQALFGNPLAEPGVTGVSAGAAVGAVLAITSGAAGTLVLPAAAFAGALLTVAAIYAIGAFSRSRGLATVLLVGIALNALLGAVVSALVANAPDEQSLRGIVFWLQGDLDARTWEHVGLALGPVVIGVAATLVFSRDLNVLLLGDDAARTSGVDAARTRHVLLVLASLLTGVAVSVSGVIGFVGLVAPHVIRLTAGPDHRLLLPASALLGAVFLVLADTAARMLLAPVTLQTGVVTAFVGAPVFLLLVLWSRRRAL
ncbi:FecCD family ABC transporter permease [Nonomuraea rubra]|uniref:Iron complex transport system permease protein n=1 Tax=Nonomuraea rubra TaxID=46180 RepID=A0A7X0P0Z6_9ACTN|nr:iron ABC transporter permease [Nonomuraea rubra]MBB6553280.1 iron complex transport system permease protein [Nonomuraea rubra]